MDEEQEILDDLKENGDLFEVAKITKYRAYRKMNDEEIEVTIGDMGPAAGNLRYHITAHTTDPENKKFATGNGGATIKEALVMLHWFDLD